VKINNIFKNIPDAIPDELIQKLIVNNNFSVERIISDGHKSPEDFWSDQNSDEFVLLLSGIAELEFKDEMIVYLEPGDYLIIPAHKKHRVNKTDAAGKTIWLTIHYNLRKGNSF